MIPRSLSAEKGRAQHTTHTTRVHTQSVVGVPQADAMASRMLARSGVAAARRVAATPASAGARRSASNLKPVDQVRTQAFFTPSKGG